MPRRAADILGEALEAPPDQRDALIESACADDDALHEEVRDLLRAHDQATGFLATPTLEPVSAIPDEIEDLSGETIGPYKLLRLIGEGGFGAVYLAEQREPVSRRVALKVIKPGMDTKQVIARFEAERQALAMMSHPYIARVFDAGATDRGRPFFVMELVRGVPITDYCDDNALPLRARLELFVKVCRAVQHAHQKGVIHRDIKPSNILVSPHDGEHLPKVIDFGIAKATNARLTERTLFTEFRQFIGTPQYMSPEQADLSGLDVDTRSDVYSLGVLLYELLVGATPLDREKLSGLGYADMQRLIREEPAARPSARVSALGARAAGAARSRATEPPALARSLRGELDWVVMRALQKQRTRRYPTAAALADDVSRYLRSEPVWAGPPSVLYRLGVAARRHKTAVFALASVVLLVLAALAGTTYGLIDASRERDRAVAAEQRQRELREEADRQRRRAEEQHALATEINTASQLWLRDTAEQLKEFAETGRWVGLRDSVSTTDLAGPIPAAETLALQSLANTVSEAFEAVARGVGRGPGRAARRRGEGRRPPRAPRGVGRGQPRRDRRRRARRGPGPRDPRRRARRGPPAPRRDRRPSRVAARTAPPPTRRSAPGAAPG